MKTFLSFILLFLTFGFAYSQITETFDQTAISGNAFTTDSGLSFTTTDTFDSYASDLQDGGVTMTAPFPRVYLDQSDSYFEITPSSDLKVFSSFSFDLWYSNSNFGTTLACECRSYDNYGNVLETLTKNVIAKRYIFSTVYGKLSKIRCNLSEINSQNAVFFDNITFSLVDKPLNPFNYNSSNDLGIESVFSNSSTGNYSFSIGIDNTASGEHSSAFGQETTASGLSSLTSGYLAVASGIYSTALGNGVVSSGDNSFASGIGTTASGNFSTAMGINTIAFGQGSTALGSATQANGLDATAMGWNNKANGGASTAIGGGTIASDYASLAIGYFNEMGAVVTNNATVFNENNTAFVIGNGLSNENRSDALSVLFDGTTTIAGDLNINSDARLKANIISLGATLSKLLQIDGKTYTMKKDANHKKKIGLLAQDIEKVFPELVTETNDIKSVNYQGLVPVLINAMKEQQEEIDSYKTELSNQESKLNKQQQKIDELEVMVKQLMTKY